MKWIFLLLPVFSFAQPEYFYDTEVRKNHVRLIWEKDAAAAGTGSAGYDIQYKRCDTCTWLTPSQAAPPSAGTDVTLYFTGDTTAVAYNIPENVNRWFRIRTITGGGPTYSAWLNSETDSEIATTHPGPLIIRTGLYPARQQGHTTDTYTYTAPNYSAEVTNEFGNDVNSITSRSGGDVIGNTWGYSTSPNYHIQSDSTVRIYFTRPEGNGSVDVNPSTWATSATETIDRVVNPGLNDTLISYKNTGTSGSYNQLIETRDGSNAVIKTFSSPYVGNIGELIPTAETSMSYDGRYIALEVYQSGDSDPRCMVYDVHNDIIVSVANPGLDLGSGWFRMSPSGRWVVWATSPSSVDGANFYIRQNDASQTDSGLGNLSGVIDWGHSDMVVTVQGHDAIFGRELGTGHSILVPLEGPKQGESIYVDSATDINPALGHVSGDNPLIPGWATADHYEGSGAAGVTPSGSNAYVYHKVYTVHLNEYVQQLGIDAYVRYYARQMTNGTRTTGSPSVYARVSPDGLYAFYNQDLPATNNSFLYGTAWRAQRTTDIGDEIPYNSGGSDVTAPSVTSVSTDQITGSSFRVTWTLDEGGTGQVEYGLTDSYGSTSVLATSYLTTHIQTIGAGINPPALLPGTTYHYRVTGQDASGNTYTGSDNTVTTTSATPVAAGVPGSAATSAGTGAIKAN